MLLLLSVFYFFSLPFVVVGSVGDIQPAYKSCLSKCIRNNHCGKAKSNFPTDLHLRLLFWSCSDECKYECMHSVEAFRYSHGHAPVQYYGKWPFTRVWGLQELFSVIFSIGNAVPHLVHLCVPKYRERFAPLQDPLRPLLLMCSLMGVFAWWWSALFHARDFWWTERFDYHCATLLILSFALQAVGRFGRQISLHWRWNVFTAFLLAAAFVAHVTHMNVVHFDYGHNMNVNAFFVVIQLLVWLVWALKVQGIQALNIFQAFVYLFRGMTLEEVRAGKHACMVMLFEISLVCAAAFETGDFPPVWGLLDAHAVWHFLTIPICSVWYRFLHHDATFRAMSHHTHTP